MAFSNNSRIVHDWLTLLQILCWWLLLATEAHAQLRRQPMSPYKPRWEVHLPIRAIRTGSSDLLPTEILLRITPEYLLDRPTLPHNLAQCRYGPDKAQAPWQ